MSFRGQLPRPETLSDLVAETGATAVSVPEATFYTKVGDQICGVLPSTYVRLWHKADMLNALTNVRFWGLSGLDQPLLTNLDLEYTAMLPWRTIFESRRPRPDLF